MVETWFAGSATPFATSPNGRLYRLFVQGMVPQIAGSSNAALLRAFLFCSSAIPDKMTAATQEASPWTTASYTSRTNRHPAR